MPVVPRIADIQCSRIQFEPGDRVLVKVNHRINQEDRKRLTRSIKKWAGVDVEVLIYCILDMDITIDKRIGKIT